jgi:hypothetical protein
MKLVVLVPSEEYKSYAGARIRYRRLAPELERQGVHLTLIDLATFDPRAEDYDVLLISKCHDAQSLVAAVMAAAQGKLVGVDLFDDYFSQTTDSRLTRYREWLGQLLGTCDFAVCSTEPMAKVVRSYDDQLPVLVVNDPAPQHDLDELGQLIAAKVAAAHDLRTLGVLWFGVGDNPFFSVGLADLCAYRGTLQALVRDRFAVELTILTNPRALNAEGLSLIRQLPVTTHIVEWSEDAERYALASALVTFLPVNAQPFSVAKSANRAVTALSSGCQLLSVGYPLYSALEPLIYRDAQSLLADLDRSSMRHSPERMDVYLEKLDALANAKNEALKLAAFLATLKPSKTDRSLPISLVHGHSTRAEAHKMAVAAEGFSVASPYCTAPLNFDVIFRPARSKIEMLVSRRAADRLLPACRSRLKGRERIRGTQYSRLSGGEPGSPLECDVDSSLAIRLATYADVMARIERRMCEAFGPCRTILSETDPLPPQTIGWPS